MEWTNNKVINLIDLYRDHPVLWDCRLKAYKDRNKRMDALMEIAVSFRVEKEEIERKIKNLVCHFSRELKKEREGTTTSRSGTTDDVYKSKWFCYDSMVFLKDRNRPRRMTDTYTQNQNTSADVEISQGETQNNDQIEEPLEHIGSSSEDGEKIKKTPIKSPYAQLRSKKCKSSATEEGFSIVEETKERNKNAVKDQYTSFGEQVGMRIRDLSSSYAQNIVKYLISTTLFEAEMGKYDNPNTFPNTFSQSYCYLPHLSQSPFSSSSVPVSIPNSSPLLR